MNCPYARGNQNFTILRSGYLAMSRLRRKAGLRPDATSPVRFKALGKQTVLLRGAEGVDAFYDSSRVMRSGAMPPFIQRPLFGDGAVHTLDGEQHRVRKNQLADVAYTDNNVDHFASLVEEELAELLQQWRLGQHLNVHDGTSLAFGRAAFRWAGISMSREESDLRAFQMKQLLDGFGRFNAEHIKARFNRIRLDRWAKKLIEEAREGRSPAADGSALAAMANLRDENGKLVDAHTAGVELQNLTRPTVAVARFAAFAATALVEHPEWAKRIGEAAEQQGGQFSKTRESIAFAQEVRRTFPFVPALPGLIRYNTVVQGCPVDKGDRVVIDVLGTNTNPREWENASTFDPERFYARTDLESLEDYENIEMLIPQGGKGVRTGHRCPGEKIAVTALAAAVSALCQPGVEISAEPEDRTFDWRKVLTRPSTGVRVAVSS